MKYTPSLTLAFEIAHAFGCSIDDVFEYNKKMCNEIERSDDS